MTSLHFSTGIGGRCPGVDEAPEDAVNFETIKTNSIHISIRWGGQIRYVFRWVFEERVKTIFVIWARFSADRPEFKRSFAEFLFFLLYSYVIRIPTKIIA